jgi:Ca2+/Na+ antiporter
MKRLAQIEIVLILLAVAGMIIAMAMGSFELTIFLKIIIIAPLCLAWAIRTIKKEKSKARGEIEKNEGEINKHQLPF